ncbi:hypothetical protein [Streptomyces poriticola]|uniref:hypothetical protein n=1 Tax=Streptomyces poriticola TaxID=3120506 RepID=UPI002FCE3A25
MRTRARARARVLPALLLAPLVLTACGTEKAAEGDGVAPGSATAADASASAELAKRARALGVAPELVYVTEASGYTLAEQSVGVSGDDGFSAAYVLRDSGAHFTLYAERGEFDTGTCEQQWTSCERDGDVWYLTGKQEHGYARPENGHVIRVRAEKDAVPRDVLRSAAEAAHRPDPAEAESALPPADPAATEPPVERGDLPRYGDGAPNNDVGVGG